MNASYHCNSHRHSHQQRSVLSSLRTIIAWTTASPSHPYSGGGHLNYFYGLGKGHAQVSDQCPLKTICHLAYHSLSPFVSKPDQEARQFDGFNAPLTLLERAPTARLDGCLVPTCTDESPDCRKTLLRLGHTSRGLEEAPRALPFD
jgi:hypothetical protein